MGMLLATSYVIMDEPWDRRGHSIKERRECPRLFTTLDQLHGFTPERKKSGLNTSSSNHLPSLAL